MPLNTAGLTALLDDGNDAVLYFAIGDGPTSADEVSSGRLSVTLGAPDGDSVIAGTNLPLDFEGPNGGTASHLLVFSALTDGTFYGSVPLDGDTLFSPSGRLQITELTLTGSVPTGVPGGFPDATNTGLAGVGLTESDLSLYTGPGGYSGSAVVTLERLLINDDIRVYDSVNITLIECKINGHIDIDSTLATLTMIDCHVDAGTWSNAAVGFQNMTITRCNIEGGITAVNASVNVTVTDSYLHGQQISPTGPDHAGGFLCSGGHDITLTHNTIVCDVLDNGFGGGPSNNLNLFGDFAPLLDITIDNNYFPVTAGGYSVSLGHNPGANFGDNPTNITFTDNVLERDPITGKGGVFGTVTSYLDANGNVYSNNVWADDPLTLVPPNA